MSSNASEDKTTPSSGTSRWFNCIDFKTIIRHVILASIWGFVLAGFAYTGFYFMVYALSNKGSV